MVGGYDLYKQALRLTQAQAKPTRARSVHHHVPPGSQDLTPEFVTRSTDWPKMYV